ncbi:lamin tail domain-containing protein [Jatrophihabitans sp. DSM 45814]
MRPDIRRVLVGLFCLILGLGSLVVLGPGAQADPGPTPPGHLVISEVNGDQSGVYRTNWVELYNPTDSAISLGTVDTSTTPATVTPSYYLCYASQAGTTCTSPYKLYGTVMAHHHFLVEIYDAGGSLPALPTGVTADLNFGSTDATVNPSQQAAKNIGGFSTGGQLLLLDASVDATGAYPTTANYSPSAYSSTNRNLADASINPSPVVDAIGFTPTSTASTLAGTEGWTSTTAVHSAPVQDASHWDERKFVDGIPQDTNDNAADFQVSQRDPISQTSSRVAVASISDTTIASSQAMTPITVAGSKGIGTLSYSATGLPDGVSIDSGTGIISGTPAAADTMGAYPVTVTATDQTPGTPDTATTSFTLTLSDDLRVDAISNVSNNKGAALPPIQVQPHGGTPAYSYAATGLPAGVSINSTGSISGTPTGAVGKYSVHVSVTDSGTGTGSNAQQTVSADFTYTELPSLTGPAAGDPLAGLTVNEVKATGTPANDFVEVYNTGSALTGASLDLADKSGAVYHATGLNIAAGGYAVVNGSDLDAAGLDLAASDTLYLTEAGDNTLLDQTSWTSFQTTSWARYPDGTGDFAVSKQATKGATNAVPDSFATDHLVIAGVFGANSDTVRWTNDWVELYNPTDSAISLGSIDTTTTPNATVTPKYALCYRGYSSTGACTSLVKLYGTVAPHHYFFIWYANAHTPADDGTYPAGFTPDLDFSVKTPGNGNQVGSNMGGCNTGGQIELLDATVGTSAINGDLSSAAAKSAGEVDGVGWMNASTNQPTAAESKGSDKVTGLDSGTNNTCVIARNFANGFAVDTDSNSSDFTPVTDLDAFTPHSQNDDRVAITPVADTEISLNEAMDPIHVQAKAIFGALNYTATGLPAGITIDPGTGVIGGTPDSADELKDYPVTVTVSDGVAGDTATVSFTLKVSKVLRLDSVADVSVAKGTALTAINVKAHGGTSPYTYSATGLPAGVTLDPSTGVISGTPTGAVGRYAVHVTATDSGVGDAQASVSLAFTFIELPPLGGPASGDPLAGLTINEVRATGTPTNDFVELYNTGSALTGASLSLVDSEGDTYSVPVQDIAAHGYVVIEGSALDTAGLDLAANDTLYLTETNGTVLDQTSWTSYQTTSWARTTDGTGAFGLSAFPTKGKANSGPPVIKPNDLLVSEVNYDNNSTDWYEYSEVTNTTDHPIDFAAYGLTLTKSGAVMTLHDPSDTTQASPTVDPVIPAHGTQLFWWVENQYFGVKTTAQFLANYGLPASTNVVLAYGFTSMANSGGDHSYYISVNQGAKTTISQAWVDTPCAANTLNGSAVCTATNGNYAEHYEVAADRTSPVAAVWYNSLHSGGDDINFVLKKPLSSPNTVDLEQVGFTRAVKITSVTSDAITLHNTSTAAVDLSGYVLQKDSAGATYTLPPGTTVAAGADLIVEASDSSLTFGGDDFATLLAPKGYAYTDGIGLADTTGPFLHTLAYDASSGEPPVIDPTTGLPLPPAGGLYRPAGVSAQNGTVYASNTGDNVVAALANGANTIVAGSLEGSGDTGDGGPATDAFLYQPGGTAEDAKGDIFIADSGDNVIREITTDGTIHLFAGTGAAGGAAEAVTSTSTPTTVNLWHPQGVAVDSSGNVFIADTFDNRILEVTTAGAISVVAGTGKASYTGDGAAATSATLSQPAGVAVDAKDDVYIADSSNNVIRRVDASTGVITTIAGDYAADQKANQCLGGFTGDGGVATSAQLNDPQAVALDGAGDLFIADTFNNAIREVTPDGTITTLVNASAVAGAENTSPTGSGAVPASTRLNTPEAVAIDRSANVLYLADTRNNAIAEVSNAGHSGNASGPVESAAALAISSSPAATNACAALVNGPVASVSVPTISGTPAVGAKLTASAGTWTPTPDSFTYQWLRDGVAIDGATQSTYDVALDDGNHLVSVAVTASKAGFGSATATSASVTVAVPSLIAGTPKISGTPTVGSTLTVKPGTWTPTPDSFTYQWLRDGKPIADATSATYTPSSPDKGHKISVTVTGTKSGYASASATSAAVSVTGASKTLTTDRPMISGTFRVDEKLTADPGTWKAGSSKLPASDLTYQWLRNGRDIAGATKSTYTLVAADNGTQVSVTVTGKYPGYETASSTSSSHTVAAGLLTTAAPTISGTFRVDEKLTANPGTWKAGSSKLPASDLTYQWLRNGRDIAGATKSTYTLVAADNGTQVSVTVTGKYPGYATASRTSTLHTVAAGLLTTAAPTISGTAKVGSTLTAKPGVWKAGTDTLSASHFTYEWDANGRRIAGATQSSYKIASSYLSQNITVIVTGSNPGYATASRTSKATAAVKK